MELDKIILKAELMARHKACRYAYEVTNNIPEGKTQSQTFVLVRESIILGARVMQESIFELYDMKKRLINMLALRAYNNAIVRKKITAGLDHEESVATIKEEFHEFELASETRKSEHIAGMTEAVEELADICIGALTELHKRGVDVHEIILSKMTYNEERKAL